MKSYFQKVTSAAPLAVFRMAVGLLLFASVIRFWSKGWIELLYIKPKHFFPFYGFEFIVPPGQYIYLIFGVSAVSALLVALGLFYRAAIVALFVSFTYIELIDKSTYLNHYYFISMVLLMMIFLPAHTYFSIDAKRSNIRHDQIPQWSLDVVKFFVCIVYVYAGLAKLNSDWLLDAQPLRIWLPAKNDTPILGALFNYEWMAYAFSWIGCIYDLSIPFLLLNRSTRLLAYLAVVVFHMLTAILFPIGMFPYIMMATALIFFSDDFHKKVISRIATWLKISREFFEPAQSSQFKYRPKAQATLILFCCIFFVIHLVFPFRYLLYPGELFWTEEGYRFSWRVMLMEKAGSAQFIVKAMDGKQVVVENSEFLTTLQEKMMATQPDMILQYAHILRDHYSTKGFESPSVFVDSYVTLNGRLGKPLIDPRVDLAKEKDSFIHKTWILPLEDEIKGF